MELSAIRENFLSFSLFQFLVLVFFPPGLGITVHQSSDGRWVYLPAHLLIRKPIVNRKWPSTDPIVCSQLEGSTEQYFVQSLRDGSQPTNGGAGNGLLGLGSAEQARLAALGAGRRKMSSPATFLGPQRPIARRLSNVGIQARKFSHGLVFGSGPATAEIVCQGRALCAQYIRSRLKRNGMFSKKCGLQRLRSAASLPGGYVVRQVLPDLISVGTELERLHPKVYTNVGRQISPLPGGAAASEKALTAGMTTVAKELCRGHMTWPMVVSVYAVAGGLAVDCVRAGHPEYMTALVDAMATALEEDMAAWIAENGGWVGLCSYCKPPSPDVSLGGVVALLGAAFFVAFFLALLLRWFRV